MGISSAIVIKFNVICSSSSNSEHSVGGNLAPLLHSPSALSPLQQQKLKEGYVTEVEYVPPSDQTCSKATTPLPSPANTLTRSTHSALPSKAVVDLTAPVPKAGADPGLLAKKQGYLPMDQSPKTKGK